MTQEENKDLEDIKESFIKINGEDIGAIFLNKLDPEQLKYDFINNIANTKEYMDIIDR